jgi:hypothetical protein
MMELADSVAAPDVVTNSSVETTGSAFSSVGNGSGAGETCCGFSSMVEAELSTGRWLSTRAMSLFGCVEVPRDVLWSGSSERLSESIFSGEEF